MLSYHVHSGSGPYLLLAHGALSNREQWALNIEPLSAFCTPVTVELLGHGASPAPEDPACYSPEAYVDYFETIRLALGATDWLLCGYSLSAGLTIRYALTHPERTIGHLFTNSRSAFALDEQAASWQKAGPGTLANVAEGGRRYLESLPFHPRFATSLPKAVYSPMIDRCGLLNPDGAARTIAYTVPAASVRNRVSQNSRPALLVNGVREKGFQAEAQYAREHMPQLRVTEVDAGHAVNMQAAAPFNAHVQECVNAWVT